MSTPLTDKEFERYAAKHRRLRGSDQLRYPPNHLRCHIRCGLDDQRDGEGDKLRISSHACMLTHKHTEPCEFSSECGMSRFYVSKDVQ